MPAHRKTGSRCRIQRGVKNLERKACAGCGSLSLQSEVSCWACGETSFVAPGTDIPAERTIAISDFGEQTLSWSGARWPWPYTPYAIAAAAALFLGFGGFWLGRATQPAASAQRIAPVQLQPQALPTPPTVLALAPFQAAPASASAAAAPAPTPDPPDPTVTVRSVARPLPGTTPARYAVPGNSGMPQMPVIGHPTARGAGVVSRDQTSGPPLSAAAAAPPILSPSKTQAVVLLRNDDSIPVEISVSGADSSRVLIAPGDTVPLPLPAGSYELRASSRGATPASSSLAVVVNRSYTLVVTRKRDSGSDVLVLLEPLLDARSG